MLAAFLDKTLLPDLKARAALPAVAAALQAHHQEERAAHRTAAHYEGFVADLLTQIGAAWILSCVFLRVLEERGLLRQRRLSNFPGKKDADESLDNFIALAPRLSTADYLLLCLREVASLPGARELLGPRHNPAFRLSPSAAGARALLDLFQGESDERRALYAGDTRFLGDLYQDLSEDARERYALLQTPDFVERFILKLTLEPAIAAFGLEEVRVIDPTCGSGHFLLGAFARLYDERARRFPGRTPREHARAALSQVYGVDLNPYAVAIARFRLTLAYLERAEVRTLAELGEIPLHLVVADSLLEGKGQRQLGETAADPGVRRSFGADLFALSDREGARRVFGQRYHAVVGNPPYITCKDAELRERYRAAWPNSAAGKYALAAPFTEFFFDLAEVNGYVGLINANSFMKREFGKKLIEKVLPHLHVQRIIDTSGAYIPGHGTPTVLLFGQRPPLLWSKEAAPPLRVVQGRRGEPETPKVPEQGRVWSAIRDHHDEVGYEDDYITVVDAEREKFEKHPWSLGGGGATELKELLEEDRPTLESLVDSIGISCFTLEDDVYTGERVALLRAGVPARFLRTMAVGEALRDWSLGASPEAVFPYDEHLEPAIDAERIRYLWPCRTNLASNVLFGNKTKVEGGLKWFEYGRLTAHKLKTPLSIAYGEIATHNHFVLDRGGKVFNRTAPIIKLPPEATEEDHLALVAYLNSSTACFWMKQVFQPKHSAEHKTHPEPERNRFAMSGTGMSKLPVPRFSPTNRALVVRYASRLLDLGAARSTLLSLAQIDVAPSDRESLQRHLAECWRRFDALREEMVALQEELDWQTYVAFGLADSDVLLSSDCDGLCCPRGSRAAERITPRKSFVRARDHLVPLAEAELPPIGALSPELEALTTRRINTIQASPELTLIEQPLFKRQWRDTDDNIDEFSFRRRVDQGRLSSWLLDQIEAHLRAQISDGQQPTCISLRELSRAFLLSPRFLAVAAVYSGQQDPDLEAVLNDLVPADSIPYLSLYRYSPEGLDKHRHWQRTWELQRLEDLGQLPLDPDSKQPIKIPVPPRYDNADFRDAAFWRLRGKLDVPRERFISLPAAERADDTSRVIGWAGWDPVQRATALMNLFHERKAQEAWSPERLALLLRGVRELGFWLKLWHNQPSADFDGERPGDLFERLLDAEARAIGFTPEALDHIQLPDQKPPRPAPRRRGEAAS